MGRIEAKILKIYDLILLQSDLDKKWIDKISCGKLVKKTMVVSNGANDDLFDLPIINDSKDILFLGILNNGYGKSLEWLMNHVWPEIRKAHKDIILHVVGRGASDDLRSRMDMDNHITYTEYLPNICDVFKNKGVMLAPIFKGFGLINKVVESMAAGVPVIGTSDSFNGITEFSNGQHGVIANDADSFIEETLKIFAHQTKRRDIADSARAIIKRNFSWDDRIRTIVKRIELIKRRK
jgi:glycosyltransferase involved in cell wall biosynthesis